MNYQLFMKFLISDMRARHKIKTNYKFNASTKTFAKALSLWSGVECTVDQIAEFCDEAVHNDALSRDGKYFEFTKFGYLKAMSY